MNSQQPNKLIKEEIHEEFKDESHLSLFCKEESDFNLSLKDDETNFPLYFGEENKCDNNVCNESSSSEKCNLKTKYIGVKDSLSELIKEESEEEYDIYNNAEFLTGSYSYEDSLDTPFENDKLIRFKLIEQGDTNKSDAHNPFIESVSHTFNACSDPENKVFLLDELMKKEYQRTAKLEDEESPHLQLIEKEDKIESDMQSESTSHISNDNSNVKNLSLFDKLMKDEYDRIANLVDDESFFLQNPVKEEYERMLKEEYEHWAKLEHQKSPLLYGDMATTFLIKRKLLAKKKAIKCYKCGSGVKYCIKKQGGVRKGVMRCKNIVCRATQSLRKTKSFWAGIDQYGRYNSKLSISVKLELVFYWCKNLSASDIVALTAESFRTVSNFMKRCQQVPLQRFKNRTQIGGSGEVVYVSYRWLPQLKKHIGGDFYDQSKSSLPLIVAVCNDNEERYFLLKKYDIAALYKIIKQEVTVGTIILSDILMECDVLLNLGYNYHVVIHDKNLNNSVVDAFILRMENVWKPVMLYECEHGINQNLSKSFLSEIWWRSLNKSGPFNAFLRDVAELF